uniref:Uncharacterized protein n=1 Tax=viral metagenome TaxID=1070528 RepID=A0A6M3LB11_9ZZZZ
MKTKKDIKNKILELEKKKEKALDFTFNVLTTQIYTLKWVIENKAGV